MKASAYPAQEVKCPGCNFWMVRTSRHNSFAAALRCVNQQCDHYDKLFEIAPVTVELLAVGGPVKSCTPYLVGLGHSSVPSADGYSVSEEADAVAEQGGTA